MPHDEWVGPGEPAFPLERQNVFPIGSKPLLAAGAGNAAPALVCVDLPPNARPPLVVATLPPLPGQTFAPRPVVVVTLHAGHDPEDEPLAYAYRGGGYVQH